MNKIEFIHTLLENEKFNPVQRERLLKLVSRELVSYEDTQSVILNDLKTIKKKLQMEDADHSSSLLVPATEEELAEFSSEPGYSINSGKKSEKGKSFAELYKEAEKKAAAFNEASVTERPANTPLLPKYLDPKDLYRFLYAYNQDPVLKYTCHQIDDRDVIEKINDLCGTTEYNFNAHKEQISEAFKRITKKHRISKNIYALIRTYIEGEGKWATENTVNWNSPELIDWCDENSGLVPHPGKNLANSYKSQGFKFKKDSYKSNVTGERINNFSSLVIHFKNLFHIRSDNSMKKLLEFRNNTKWNEQIDVEFDEDHFWENIELFTDVDKLLQAYDKIITIILNSSGGNADQRPKVRLRFHEQPIENNGVNIVFGIHHVNSTFKKTALNLVQRIGEAHTDLIKLQINGLCELHLTADFNNKQYGSVNLWDNQKRVFKAMDTFEGVEHILIFKK